jgi:hypothetical protein
MRQSAVWSRQSGVAVDNLSRESEAGVRVSSLTRQSAVGASGVAVDSLSRKSESAAGAESGVGSWTQPSAVDARVASESREAGEPAGRSERTSRQTIRPTSSHFRASELIEPWRRKASAAVTDSRANDDKESRADCRSDRPIENGVALPTSDFRLRLSTATPDCDCRLGLPTRTPDSDSRLGLPTETVDWRLPTPDCRLSTALSLATLV